MCGICGIWGKSAVEKIQKMLEGIMPKNKVTVLGDYAAIDRIVIIETQEE